MCVNGLEFFCHEPDWLQSLVEPKGHISPDRVSLAIAEGYFVLAAILFALSMFLLPNANSLHPLYRDRLAKAFLFEPKTRLSKYEELKPLRKRLSEITGLFG